MNGKIFLFAVLAAVVITASGCPKEKRALGAARKAVEVAAMTVDLVDAEVATLYRVEADSALEACETRTCYRNKMRRWDKTVTAVVAMKHSLLTVENALDTWEAGSPSGQNNLLGAAACFAEALGNLQSLLTELDVKAPALDHGLDYIDNLFGSGSFTCTIGAT